MNICEYYRTVFNVVDSFKHDLVTFSLAFVLIDVSVQKKTKLRHMYFKCTELLESSNKKIGKNLIHIKA